VKPDVIGCRLDEHDAEVAHADANSTTTGRNSVPGTAGHGPRRLDDHSAEPDVDGGVPGRTRS